MRVSGVALQPVACCSLMVGVETTAFVRSEAEAEQAELMARYCDGELAAFLRLYQITAPRILTYLATLTADAALAKDLLQETFLRLHEHRKQYVRGANPVPWISTLAHACFLNRQKTLRAGRRLDRHAPALVVAAPAVPMPAEKIR
jgi:DNA-directed RNA polymerase specialized sigma24 family protein